MPEQSKAWVEVSISSGDGVTESTYRLRHYADEDGGAELWNALSGVLDDATSDPLEVLATAISCGMNAPDKDDALRSALYDAAAALVGRRSR